MTLFIVCPRAVQGRRRGHTSVEFVASLFVFFLVILFPLINLMGLAVSAGTVCLLTHQIATRASTQQTFGAALQAMTSECANLATTGFANFLNLRRSGGYNNCGCDLFVQSTNVSSGATITYPANSPVPPPINGAENVYEYVANTYFTVKPLIPMDGIPLVQKVPGLGQPVQLTWRADRAAEYIQGLATAPAGTTGGALTPLGLDAYAGPPPPSWNGAPGESFGWRDPTIYTQIANAGETIVGQTVLTVLADNYNWTPTVITVTTGEKIWIDTQAVGIWRDEPTHPTTDANGFTYLGSSENVGPGLPVSSLIGRVGTSGVPFFLGDDQFNYPPAGTGIFSMIFNDKSLPRYFSDNTGIQVVRVIVTR